MFARIEARWQLRYFLHQGCSFRHGFLQNNQFSVQICLISGQCLFLLCCKWHHSSPLSCQLVLLAHCPSCLFYSLFGNFKVENLMTQFNWRFACAMSSFCTFSCLWSISKSRFVLQRFQPLYQNKLNIHATDLSGIEGHNFSDISPYICSCVKSEIIHCFSLHRECCVPVLFILKLNVKMLLTLCADDCYLLSECLMKVTKRWFYNFQRTFWRTWVWTKAIVLPQWRKKMKTCRSGEKNLMRLTGWRDLDLFYFSCTHTNLEASDAKLANA